MKLERFIYFLLGVLVGAMLTSHCRAQVSIMGGVAKFEKPHDGIYWNHNQSHDMELTPPVWGARYDWDNWAIQYTNFGTVRTNALAVSEDAPRPGGYIGGTGQCVGTCAPLWRWKMESETQSLAFIRKWKFGNWIPEIGLNVFEIKTKGYFADGNVIMNTYKPARWLDVGPMAGIAYKVNDRFSIHYQIWRMEGKGTDNGNHPPPNFNESHQQTLMASWSF